MTKALEGDGALPIKEHLFAAVTYKNRPDLSPLQLILPRSMSDTIQLIRVRISQKFPHLMTKINSFENQSNQGRRLAAKKAALQDEISAIGASVLLKSSGVSSYQLAPFSGSYTQAIIESFPLLELEATGFSMKWVDRKAAVAEIRKKIFRAYPDMEIEIVEIENLLKMEQSVGRRQLNRVRSRLMRITSRDLI
ncbi:MAG: hypothetical protein KJ732_06490, partial [Candidatus Margulisbacteria bacterium]|nr:hypothetical protein [Candidatus Margulisiibacteriota bacterium]